MAEGPDDVRYDMVITRQRMAETVAEIETRVSDTVDGVKAKLDLPGWVRAHPWPALALAVGAGFALSATGRDRAAASTVADASRSAAAAVGDAAAGVVDQLRDRFSGDGESATARRPPEPSLLDRLGARLASGLADAFRGPAAELARGLTVGAGVRGNGGRPTMEPPISPHPLGAAGEARL